MKRLLLSLIALAGGLAFVLIYLGAARDRDYRRLIEAGDQALARDETFVAVEAYSGAIALKGDSMLGYLRRGETYHRRGDLQAALRDLREAARLDPTAPRPREQLGDIDYAMGLYRRAADRYSEYVRLDNQNARVLYKLGLSRYREGNLAAAVPPLRRAVELDDRFEEALYLLGLCLREQEPIDEALKMLNRAVTLAPGSIEIREALANIYAELGRTRDEIGQLEALAALDPGRADRLVNLGLAYARANRTDLAVVTLGRAVEQHPEPPHAYLALARIWLDEAEARQDRVALNKAFEALQHVIGRAPASSEALTVYGRALLLAGDPTMAERVLQRAAGQFPVTPQALWYLARLAERNGELGRAREALVKFDALAGPRTRTAERAAYLAKLGDLSLRLDDPAGAIGWFARAVEVQPTAELLGRFAEARWRAGDADAARELLDRALQQEPGNRALLALQRRIK